MTLIETPNIIAFFEKFYEISGTYFRSSSKIEQIVNETHW